MLRRRGLTLRSVAGVALALVALGSLIVRLPPAFRQFDNSAAAEAGHNAEGGALALADLLGVDEDFVSTAIHALPRNAKFAVLVPDPLQAQKTYGVRPVTIEGVPSFMQEVLLPRRQVDAAQKGVYVLCYLCDTSPLDQRTRWVWKGTKGDDIGLVYR